MMYWCWFKWALKLSKWSTATSVAFNWMRLGRSFTFLNIYSLSELCPYFLASSYHSFFLKCNFGIGLLYLDYYYYNLLALHSLTLPQICVDALTASSCGEAPTRTERWSEVSHMTKSSCNPSWKVSGKVGQRPWKLLLLLLLLNILLLLLLY